MQQAQISFPQLSGTKSKEIISVTEFNNNTKRLTNEKHA
jgi:hypothetical protein